MDQNGSPFSNEVYELWDEFTSIPYGQRMEDKRTLSGKLMALGVEADRWKLSASDAELIASSAVTLAFEDGNFEEVVRLAEFFLSHEGLDMSNEHHEVSVNQFRCWIGQAYLEREEPDKAAMWFRRALQIPHETLAKRVVRNSLYASSRHFGSKKMDAEIQDFVDDLLSNWGEAEGKTVESIPCKTYADLAELLQKTYSAKPKRRPKSS